MKYPKSEKEIQKAYSDWYEDPQIHKDKIVASKVLFQKVKTYIPKSSKNILDVGSGAGEFGIYFAKKLQGKAYGIEINAEGVAISKKRGMRIFQSDLNEKWKLPKQKFEVIILNQIIEHIYNTDHLLTESKPLLSENGIVVITTPNLSSWYNRILLLLGYQPFYTEVSVLDKTIGLSFTRGITSNRTPVGHIRVFTYRALKELLVHHGYDILLAGGSAVPYFPSTIAIIDRLFSNIPWLASDLIFIARKKNI